MNQLNQKKKIKMKTINCGNYYDVKKDGRCIGTLSKFIDIKYKFVPDCRHLILDESDLRWIADRLIYLNK